MSVIEFFYSRIESINYLFRSGLYINDLSMHDASREYVLVGSKRSSDLKVALKHEISKTKALEENTKKLDEEIKKGDELLYRMLPKNVADRLRNGEPAINLCEVILQIIFLFLFLLQLFLLGLFVLYNSI